MVTKEQIAAARRQAAELEDQLKQIRLEKELKREQERIASLKQAIKEESEA